ncbi:hypothetical protein ABPG75_010407 [Micractinium tetrahymenae]
MSRAAFIATTLLVSALCARAQTEFLPLLFSEEPKLTEEQAAQVVGVWDQVGGFRLDGSVLDDALRQAVEAAADGNSTDVDFAGVLADAASPFDALSFKLFIPAIDTATGAFWAYYLIGPKGKKPAVTRVLGMGAATKDGVLLTGTKDEDTGTWYGLVKNDTTLVALYMEGLEAWNADRTEVLDNQVVAQYTYAKLPPEEIQAALALVVAKGAKADNSSQGIAATDRETHGGSGSK